jgi:hypothetical protein
MTRRTIAAAAILSLTFAVVPASADDSSAAAATPGITVNTRIEKALSRPKTLPALYASYAALQAFDVYSTNQALARGAKEANPLMQGVVGNTGAFVAVKATVAVATIVAAERLWKTNKAAAIGIMVASNGVAAVVAARNARVLRQQR